MKVVTYFITNLRKYASYAHPSSTPIFTRLP